MLAAGAHILVNALITNLHIQWPLLLAQAVNFLILLFLLKKFVYKPLLGLLQKREGFIRESVEKHEAVEKKFREIQEYRAKLLFTTRKEAQKILEDAFEKAAVEREELLAKTRKELDGLFARAQKEIEGQKEDALRQAEKEMKKMLMPAIQRILFDSSDEETQKAILATAAQRIEKLYSSQ